MQYSTTQANNLLVVAGLVALILNKFGVTIAQDELAEVFGYVLAAYGVIAQWIHRFKKGDVTVGGFRK